MTLSDKEGRVGVRCFVLSYLAGQVDMWRGWHIAAPCYVVGLYRTTYTVAAAAASASCNRCHLQPPPCVSASTALPSLPLSPPFPHGRPFPPPSPLPPHRLSNLRFCHSSAPNRIPIIATGEHRVVLFSPSNLRSDSRQNFTLRYDYSLWYVVIFVENSNVLYLALWAEKILKLNVFLCNLNKRSK